MLIEPLSTKIIPNKPIEAAALVLLGARDGGLFGRRVKANANANMANIIAAMMTGHDSAAMLAGS